MFVNVASPSWGFNNRSASSKKLCPQENAFSGSEKTPGLSEYACRTIRNPEDDGMNGYGAPYAC